MYTASIFPPKEYVNLPQIPVNSASWSSEDEHVPGSVELSARQGPESCSRWPDVKHSNGPKVRRFLLFFFARLFDLGGGNSSIFSCSPPKIGEDVQPILTCAYVS